jgi:hypothetical protein
MDAFDDGRTERLSYSSALGDHVRLWVSNYCATRRATSTSTSRAAKVPNEVSAMANGLK